MYGSALIAQKQGQTFSPEHFLRVPFYVKCGRVLNRTGDGCDCSVSTSYRQFPLCLESPSFEPAGAVLAEATEQHDLI